MNIKMGKWLFFPVVFGCLFLSVNSYAMPKNEKINIQIVSSIDKPVPALEEFVQMCKTTYPQVFNNVKFSVNNKDSFSRRSQYGDIDIMLYGVFSSASRTEFPTDAINELKDISRSLQNIPVILFYIRYGSKALAMQIGPGLQYANLSKNLTEKSLGTLAYQGMKDVLLVDNTMVEDVITNLADVIRRYREQGGEPGPVPSLSREKKKTKVEVPKTSMPIKKPVEKKVKAPASHGGALSEDDIVNLKRRVEKLEKDVRNLTGDVILLKQITITTR